MSVGVSRSGRKWNLRAIGGRGDGEDVRDGASDDSVEEAGGVFGGEGACAVAIAICASGGGDGGGEFMRS